MRIDKYLKVARILKRRTTGKNLALNERLAINGRQAKPSRQVKVGDIITIYFGEREMSVRVLALAEHIRKEEACSLFEVVDEKKGEEDDSQKENENQVII